MSADAISRLQTEVSYVFQLALQNYMDLGLFFNWWIKAASLHLSVLVVVLVLINGAKFLQMTRLWINLLFYIKFLLLISIFSFLKKYMGHYNFMVA